VKLLPIRELKKIWFDGSLAHPKSDFSINFESSQFFRALNSIARRLVIERQCAMAWKSPPQGRWFSGRKA
jgi:hypothetical protein